MGTAVVFCVVLICIVLCIYLYLFISDLRPIGPNVLGYQSHLLQRCHPATVVTKDLSSHLSPVLAYNFLSRCKFSTFTTRQPRFSRFPLRKKEYQVPNMVLTRIEPTTSALIGSIIVNLGDEYGLTTL